MFVPLAALKMKTLEPLEESNSEIKDKLLQLIEEGDATVILSSEYTESLNELIKSEFISIENDALQLTEKGQKAKITGVKTFLEDNLSLKEELKISDFPQPKFTGGISYRAFLFILFFFFVSLTAMAGLMML